MEQTKQNTSAKRSKARRATSGVASPAWCKRGRRCWEGLGCDCLQEKEQAKQGCRKAKRSEAFDGGQEEARVQRHQSAEKGRGFFGRTELSTEQESIYNRRRAWQETTRFGDVRFSLQSQKRKAVAKTHRQQMKKRIEISLLSKQDGGEARSLTNELDISKPK
jgi:hypothetical protein